MPYADPQAKREYMREYWARTRETQNARRDKNRASELHKIWRESNLAKRAEDMRRWRQIPANRIASNLRSRVANALQGRIKTGSLVETLGCSIEELKAWLAGWFEPGMTWENYGQWEIDHARPCASFDLTVLEHQKRCFHFLNLRPLWKVPNRVKGKRYVL